MIPAKNFHKVPDPFSSFREVAPGVVVDALRPAEDSISQAFGRFYSFRPHRPRRKPLLQVIAHQKVADLVPLLHLFLSVLLPVVEPPSSFHIEIRHLTPRLDHMELEVHENFNSQLPDPLLRVGVLLPAQEGQSLEAGLCGRLS